MQEKFRKEFADRLPCLRCLKDKSNTNNQDLGRTERTDLCLQNSAAIRGRHTCTPSTGNGRVALLSHANNLELSVPARNRNSRAEGIIKIEVHRPENKVVSRVNRSCYHYVIRKESR